MEEEKRERASERLRGSLICEIKEEKQRILLNELK